MPVFVALAYADGSGPVATVAYRCVLALPVLAILAVIERRRGQRRSWTSRGYAFGAGLLLAIDLVLFNHTITDAGAGVSTVIGSVYVPLVAVLAWALLGERPTRRYLVTLPIVLVGIVLASGLIGGSGTGHLPAAGTVYGLIANVAYAGYLLVLRRAGASAGASVSAGAGAGAGATRVAGQLFDATAGTAVGALGIGLIFGGLHLAVSLGALGWLVLLALVVQVAGWLLISGSLPQLPASLSSMLLLLQPALALILAAVVLSEWPTALQWAGAAIAGGGVVAAAMAKQKPTAHISGSDPSPMAAEGAALPMVRPAEPC
jgi:drug/metabolite transporter (DMT)-like permease